MHHLHVHLVPKYRDGYEWGDVFAMNPHKAELTDAEYQELIEKIRAAL
jgi:diadenosine tetraphosphate (Ap4A) HIT family hydrolase